MGFSNFQASAQGFLSLILATIPLSFSFFKPSFFSSVLRHFGIRVSSSLASDYYYDQLFKDSQAGTFVNEFRDTVQAVRFDTIRSVEEDEHDEECSVCLSQFEADSVIYCLSCGHIFHKFCLEKWLHYLNSTCPLCRSSVMSNLQEDTRSL